MPRHMTYMCIYETALCYNEISVFKITTTTTTTNFIENWKITNYITFPPANSL